MAFTDDRCLWNDLEHAFAGFMTELVTPKCFEKEWDAVDFLDAHYVWVLEYGRGLEQEAYVEWVRTYAPNLLHIVEV